MSNHPHPAHYEFHHQPENYFIEEPEGYLEGYPEVDCIQENLGCCMMGELYGRNATVVPVHVMYNGEAPHMIPKQHSEQFIQQAYYKRNGQLSPRSYYARHCEPSRDFYPNSTISQHDLNMGTKAYQSAYHNMEQYPTISYRKNKPEVEYSRIPRPVVSKKFPVTFPIPKYYKKPPPNAVYKRPSALCLPGATQPDPAVIRRHRKVPVFTENYYEGTSELEEMPPESPKKAVLNPADYEIPHKVDCQGDVNVKMPNFDDMFEQLEKKVTTHETENKDELAKFAKLLKPRVPASIRAKQDKHKLKASKINAKHINVSNEPQQQTNKNATSIEKLLNQLKKCELVVSKDETGRNSPKDKDKKERGKKDCKNQRDDEKGDLVDEEILNLKLNSFNYQDINENMRTKCNVNNVIEESQNDEHLTAQLNSISNCSSKPKVLSRPILDDNCALELHRSKSYIVNLIDRALSKELGTVPSGRHFKEPEMMSPKRAIELLNRHAGDSNVGGSIAGSHASTCTNHETLEVIDEDKLSTKCKVCHCNSDEPAYIKQLKQLRWGHLKHIQREIKRLEELERFLDSCSVSTFSET